MARTAKWWDLGHKNVKIYFEWNTVSITVKLFGFMFGFRSHVVIQKSFPVLNSILTNRGRLPDLMHVYQCALNGYAIHFFFFFMRKARSLWYPAG